jgi:hypothetical protein
MSFIYEALKRAEDEHAKGVPVPRVIRRPSFFVERPRWWLWVLIAVLGVNALVVTLIFVRSPRPPEVALATVSQPVATPVVAPAPPPAPTPVVAPPTPVVASPAPVVAPPAKAVTSAPPAARKERPAAPPVAPAARPAPPTAVVATPVAPPPAVAPAPAAVITPSSPPVPSSPPAPGPAAPPAVDTPKIQIQVVLYSEVPAERLVFIDGRRYAEGDKVDADTVVERITPQGAVVSRRGQSFTLTSGR